MPKFIKRLSAAAASAAIMLGASAAPAVAFPVPLYDYTFYSDATYQTPVGFLKGRCYGNMAGVESSVQGESTPYYTREQVGECPQTEW